MNEQVQDLTPSMQEMMVQMAAMRAELNSLKERANVVTPSAHQAKTVVTTTRRNTLRRLGLALLGGAVAATAVGAATEVQARVIANPQTNGLANKAGMVVLPPGAADPTGTVQNYKYGLIASSNTTALDMNSLPPGNTGLYGSGSATGVYGTGLTGVYGSGSATGVYGSGTTGVYGFGTTGVLGSGSDTGISGSGLTGVSGDGTNNGVYGSGSTGVYGTGSSYGVFGTGTTYGLYGSSSNNGVYGSGTNYGVYGASSATGVYGTGGTFGVKGVNIGGAGTAGVRGEGTNIGVWGVGSNSGVGIYGDHGPNGTIAAIFVGSVSKSSGTFKIDHPLDPAGKYLYHSFVESPDMMNIYNGIVTLDNQGETTVEMPGWFEALNSDFRYQLTCLGQYGPVFIAEEIKERRFKIGGGIAGQKVSWQVTGIRQDEWAKAHPIQVEEDKSDKEKGFYLHPELFGQPKEKSVSSLMVK